MTSSDTQTLLRAAMAAVRDCAGTMDTQATSLLQSLLTVVERQTGMDALMMRAVGAMTDVVDQLEQTAERDEANEGAFVLVIEAIGVLLQALEKAKTATLALDGALATGEFG